MSRIGSLELSIQSSFRCQVGKEILPSIAFCYLHTGNELFCVLYNIFGSVCQLENTKKHQPLRDKHMADEDEDEDVLPWLNYQLVTCQTQHSVGLIALSLPLPQRNCHRPTDFYFFTSCSFQNCRIVESCH